MMRETKIDLVGKYYDKTFPEGWVTYIDYAAGEEDATFAKYNDTFTDFEANALYFVMHSVLSGEYIVKDYLSERIDSLRDKIHSDLPVKNDELKQKIIARASSIIEHLDYYLRRYRLFIESINNQYSLSQTQYVFHAYRFKGHPQNKGTFQQIYEILFSVAEYDHRLSYENKKIRDLILNHTALTDIIQDDGVPPLLMPAIKALDGKCLFILKKLLIYDKAGVDYTLDFEPKHLDTDTIKQEWLKDLEDRFEFYRADNTYGNAYGRQLDDWSYHRQLRVSLSPLLMKYNKDNPSESLGQINNIITEFDKQYTRLLENYKNRPYDLYALNTLKSYMYNSRLTFRLKRKDYSFEDLQKEVEYLRQLQQEMRIVDYYPYMCAAEYIGEMINDKNKGNLEENKAMLVKLEDYVNLFDDSFRICSQQSFYPLQSLYNDSLIPYQSFGPVFFASSYCRPVQYQTIRKRLEALQTKLLLYQNALYLKEERVEIESIKERIDQSKKQNIEIISVFTAIITFLFGTIDFFSSAKSSSFQNQVYNIVSLGIILLLFVSSIAVLTTRHEDKFKNYFNHPRVWLSIGTIGVLLILLLYLVISVAPKVVV